jgi:3(or 17)beta-hydroxysteroid dehydrogenase
MERVKRKVGIVTGAASEGIGQAIARKLAEEGARIVITDINLESGEATAEKLRSDGLNVIFMAQDVRQEEDWRRVVADTLKIFGHIDILVNNAGIVLLKSVEDTSLADFRGINAVNLDGPFLGMKHTIPAIRKSGRGGSVINISSIAGKVGMAMGSAYCASKGGLRLMTKAMALECAQLQDGIRVNSIHPGFVVSDMTRNLSGGNIEEMSAAYMSSIPLASAGQPEDIANAALYLASDVSKFATGTEFVVDGGLTAL